VHFALDLREHDGNPLGGNFAVRYWMEMSAVWMEEKLYDHINDYYSYLSEFFNRPLSSIQQFRSVLDQHPYASVVFPIFLSERYGDGIIKSIWDHCGDVGGPTFFPSVQNAIDSASASAEDFGTEFREFVLWNFFTGDRADNAPDDIGYSEKAFYPTIPDDRMDNHISYPVFQLINTNEFRPYYNGASYLHFGEVRSSARRYWRVCTPQDPPGFPCPDSIEVLDTTLGYEWIDSTFSVWLFYDFNYRPWGLNVVYQLDDEPDSFFVEQFMLPVFEPRDGVTNKVTVQSFFPERYRSITYILSPGVDVAALYYEQILSDDETARLGYSVDERTIIDEALVNLPSAVLMPYPNPAVVGNMSEEVVSFAFQVDTDTASVAIYSSPTMQVDIYTIAGELVASITDMAFHDELRGRYTIEWDMRSAAGSEVASGAYLAYARLFSDPDRSTLLAEDRVKVAIIR
jgi:hypothetical protein